MEFCGIHQARILQEALKIFHEIIKILFYKITAISLSVQWVNIEWNESIVA